MILLALLTVVSPLLTGALLVRALAPALPRLLRVFLGVGFGIGAVSCCLFLSLVASAPWPVLEVLLLSVLVAVNWRLEAPRVVASAPEVNLYTLSMGSVFAGVTLCAVYGFVSLTRENPHGLWDAWAVHNLHARFLATDWWLNVFSSNVAFSHPDYPLLLPAYVARYWRAVGAPELWAPAVGAFLFTFATAGLLVAAVAELKGKAQGLLAGVVLLGTPYFIEQGASQYADVPLSFFILATLALFALQDRLSSFRGIEVLAGVAAGLAGWTKNEGLLLAAVVLPVRMLFLWRFRDRQIAFRQARSFLAGIAPILVIIYYFRVAYAPPNYHLSAGLLGVQGLIGDPQRWRITLGSLLNYATRFDGAFASLALILLLYLVCTGVSFDSNRASIATGAGVLFLMLAGYCVVCVITPVDIVWQIATALSRLLLQLWPATVFLGFLAAGNVRLPSWRRAAAAAAESAEPAETPAAIVRRAAFPEASFFAGTMNRPLAGACLVVLLLGAAVRLANIDNVKTRTPDEQVYTSQATVLLDRGIEGSRSMVADYLRDQKLQLYPPPTRIGYFAILAAAMRLTGVRTESVGGWLSCAASIAALGLTMLIGYQFFDPWVGLTAGVFLSVFPPELVLARRTWEEALINFLTLLLVYCGFGIRQDPSLRWRYAVLGGAGGLLLLIKESSPMIFGLCVLWAGFELVWRKRWRDVLWLAGSGLLGLVGAEAAITVTAGGLSVWLRVFRIILAENAANQYAIQYCTGPGYLLAAGFGILSPLVTVLAATGLILALLRRGSLLADRSNAIGLAAFTLLFAALPVILPHWLNLRYVSVLNGTLCLLAALAACQIWRWARVSLGEPEVTPALALACFVLALGAATDYQRFQERYIQAETADLAIRMVLDFPQ